MKTLGQVGYEAYSKFTNNKTYDGREMPKWEELPPKIQGAWEASSEAMLKLARAK